jgi:hypothetical protein
LDNAGFSLKPLEITILRCLRRHMSKEMHPKSQTFLKEPPTAKQRYPDLPFAVATSRYIIRGGRE